MSSDVANTDKCCFPYHIQTHTILEVNKPICCQITGCFFSFQFHSVRMIRGLMSSWLLLLLSVAKSGVTINAVSSTFPLLCSHYSHFLNVISFHADGSNHDAVTMCDLKGGISPCHGLQWKEWTVQTMRACLSSHRVQCPHQARTMCYEEHSPAP